MHLWAAAPDKNPLNSARVINPVAQGRDLSGFALTGYYQWPSLGDGVRPNEGRFADSDLRVDITAEPTGVEVGYLEHDLLDLLTPGTPLDADGDGQIDAILPLDTDASALHNGQTVTYTVHYANDGPQTARNVRLTANAFGALHFAGSDTLVVNLGDIGPGITGTVSFSAGVDAARNSHFAEMDAVLSDEAHGDYDWFWVHHPLDGDPPTDVAINAPTDYARPGVNIVLGTADDPSGVAGVTLEVRALPDGTVITVNCPSTDPASDLWTCLWDAGPLVSATRLQSPATVTAYELRARATDVFGNVSDWTAPLTLPVDTTPPTVTLDTATEQALQDGLIGPDELRFTGHVVDNRQAAGVKLCIDGALWPDCLQSVVLPGTDPTGSWDFDFTTFLSGDGVTRTLAIYGQDGAGNLSQPVSRTFQVDVVAPVVTVTQAITRVLLSDYAPGATSATPVLSGTVNDGGGLDAVYVRVESPDGDVTWPLADRDRDTWSYTPQLRTTGRYTLTVEAYDQAGNASGYGPFGLLVACTTADLAVAFVTAEPAYLSRGAGEQRSEGAEEQGSGGAEETLPLYPGTSAPRHLSTSAPVHPGSVDLTVRVSNTGGVQVPAGVSVAFYLGDPGAGGALIGTAVTTQALNAGESEDVTVTWDAGAPGDHTITIVADDDGTGTGQVAECSKADNTTWQTVSILDVPLAEGWNLISSYVNPFNTDASVVQRPIAGQYVVIQGFDGGAQSYYPDLPPAVNTLKEMDGEHGYWIKVKPAGELEGTQGNSGELRGTEEVSSASATVSTLRMVGSKFAEDRPLALDAGWNLVSYLPRQPLPVADALQSIAGQYFAVLSFDQGALSYYPDLDDSFNTLTTMQPLHGYWIKMDQAGMLQYPNAERGTLNAEHGTQRSSFSIPHSSFSTPVWVNFYGSTSLPVGATVLAVDPDGVVCGATVVTYEGRYGLLACYGDDPTTSEDEGARAGDTVRLVVDGEVLGTGTWMAHGGRQWVPLGEVRLWRVWLPMVEIGD